MTCLKGETIGKNLEACLKECRIKKVCCVMLIMQVLIILALTYLIKEMSDIKKTIA
jgi:hypothetical protein